MGRWLRPALVVLAVALVAALAAGLRYAPLTPWGRGLLERQFTGLKVGRVGHLRVEGLEGDPWRAFTVRRLAIYDAHGEWLEARSLSVRWQAAGLLERNVHATALSARSVLIERRPSLTPPGKRTLGPVSIQVDHVAVPVELSPKAAWRRGLYRLAGRLKVERSNAVRADLSATSVLHPGDFLAARFDVGAERFMVQAHAREARGGALAGLLGLAADQPFGLAVSADGTVHEGRFTALTTVGAARPLDAAGAWNRQGGSAHGRVQLAASRLLAPYARTIGAEARFTASGAKGRGGFENLVLDAQSDNLALHAAGRGDIGMLATGPGGVTIQLNIADLGRLVGAPGQKTSGQTSLGLGPAVLRGGLGGARAHWVFDGAGSVSRVALPGYALARLAGPIKLEGRAGALEIQTDLAGEGGTGAGLAAALLGARPRGAAKITRLADGRMLVRALALRGAGLNVAATGSRGLLGGLDFKGQAQLANLAAARPGARGSMEASWSASQGGAGERWRFGFDARARAFASGLGELDRLLGPAPRLTAAGAFDGGVVALEKATVEGSAGALTTAGLVGPAGALKLRLDWRARGPLLLGPLEISGSAKGTGALTGTLAAPRADLLADFGAIDSPPLPLRDAHVVLQFQGGPQGPTGRFALTAASQYGPARAAAAFHFAPAGIDLTAVDIDAGGVTAAGAISLRTGEPSSADLTFAAGPGALLAAGHASGRLAVVSGRGPTHATISLKAADAELRQGGAVRSLMFTADGPLGHLPYQAKAEGATAAGPWRLAGSGVIAEAAGDYRIAFSGAGKIGRADFKTLAPADIEIGPHGRGARLQLAVGSGHADAALSDAGGQVAVKAALTGLNLALIDPDYVGRFDANLALSGRGPELTGQMRAHVTGAGGRDLKGADLLAGEIGADLAHGNLRLDASMSDGHGLKAQGEVILPTVASASPFRIAINRKQPIQGRFDLNGELRPLWDLVNGGDIALSGKVVAAGTIHGTLADPSAVGTASLDGGRFEESSIGLKLDQVSLRATLGAEGVDIGQFSATDGAKGAVTGSGRINLRRDSASSFHLDLKAFRLIDNDLAQASASGQVSVNRAADGKVKLSGGLAIDRAQIAPNPPVPSGVAPMEVVEVHRPTRYDQRFVSNAARQGPVELDIGLKAPGGIFIRGRGLNLELSLDAHVGGTTAAPILTGAARVVRGDYNFAGKRFQISDQGVIRLGSTPETIRLNLSASRDDPSLSAVINITGTAARPIVQLTSVPVLPQDEVLSQLLFGASAAQLSPIQAAQLASALAGLAGNGGFDVLGGLRNLAHLDRLAIGSSTTTGTTVSGGKYITDKVYLEITGGGREGTVAQVEWRVKRHLSLLSRLTSQGESELSIRWRKDY